MAKPDVIGILDFPPFNKLYATVCKLEISARRWTIFAVGSGLVPLTNIPNFFWPEMSWPWLTAIGVTMVLASALNFWVGRQNYQRYRHYRAARLNLEILGRARSETAVEHAFDQVDAALAAVLR